MVIGVAKELEKVELSTRKRRKQTPEKIKQKT